MHLEADLLDSVAWAEKNQQRWAFTLSNAGAYYFEDRCNLAQLGEIDWDAVQAVRWSGNGISPSVKEGKQAEFLLEQSFPWELVSRIGVRSMHVRSRITEAIRVARHQPKIDIKPDWYY